MWCECWDWCSITTPSIDLYSKHCDCKPVDIKLRVQSAVILSGLSLTCKFLSAFAQCAKPQYRSNGSPGLGGIWTFNAGISTMLILCIGWWQTPHAEFVLGSSDKCLCFAVICLFLWPFSLNSMPHSWHGYLIPSWTTRLCLESDSLNEVTKSHRVQLYLTPSCFDCMCLCMFAENFDLKSHRWHS